MKPQNSGRRSDYCCSLLAEWNLFIKRLCYLQIKNAKHYFDRDFPQSGAMPINYFAQGLHRKFGGK
jgi:hypothetical protein